MKPIFMDRIEEISNIISYRLIELDVFDKSNGLFMK